MATTPQDAIEDLVSCRVSFGASRTVVVDDGDGKTTRPKLAVSVRRRPCRSLALAAFGDRGDTFNNFHSEFFLFSEWGRSVWGFGHWKCDRTLPSPVDLPDRCQGETEGTRERSGSGPDRRGGGHPQGTEVVAVGSTQGVPHYADI